jgi:two-component system chemotaxis response regulator CheB
MTFQQGEANEACGPPAKRLIAIGASAGGVEAVIQILAHLPNDLPAAIAVVVHHPIRHLSALASILDRAGRLEALDARDGEVLQPGRILVAASAHHLVIQAGRVWLLDCARVNKVRPSIDPLFQSAAIEYGQLLVAVILSGTGNDGSAGLVTVRRAGGLAVVQDPDDAAFADMPRHALNAAGADYVASSREMPSLLDRLVRQGLSPGAG